MLSVTMCLCSNPRWANAVDRRFLADQTSSCPRTSSCENEKFCKEKMSGRKQKTPLFCLPPSLQLVLEELAFIHSASSRRRPEKQLNINQHKRKNNHQFKTPTPVRMLLIQLPMYQSPLAQMRWPMWPEAERLACAQTNTLSLCALAFASVFLPLADVRIASDPLVDSKLRSP